MSRMTVLQLLPDLNVGGVERGTVEIASALITAGHRALVISNHGRLVDELQRSGAEHIALPIGEKKLSTLKYIRKLRDIIVKEKVDIVHARSRLPAWIGHLAIRGLPENTRPRWVTTVHGPYSVNRYSRIMLSGEKIIAISEFIKAYILDNYPDVDAKRIALIHRGVDSNAYNQDFLPSPQWLAEFNQQAFGGSGIKRLIFPGRLTRWKGQADFISLMARLRDANEPVVGLIVGGQSDKQSHFAAELEEQVRRLGLSEKIFFLGNRADLRELLAVSDISFSLPNVPEAFGRTTLEALAVGTPVIGYDEGGTGEILKHLLPSGRVQAADLDMLYDRTVAFLHSPPRIAENTEMTTRNMQRATLAIYESLLGKL